MICEKLFHKPLLKKHHKEAQDFKRCRTPFYCKASLEYLRPFGSKLPSVKLLIDVGDQRSFTMFCDVTAMAFTS